MERLEPKPDIQAPLSFESKPCRAPICSDLAQLFFELLSYGLAGFISWDPNRGWRDGGGAGPGGADTRAFGWGEAAGVHLSCLLESIKATVKEQGWEVTKMSFSSVTNLCQRTLPCDHGPLALRAELLPPRAFLYLLPLCFPQVPPAAACSAPRTL